MSQVVTRDGRVVLFDSEVVTFDLAAAIAAVPASPDRTVTVQAESRVVTVEAEERTVVA